ncbi:MAG: FKBP-type peptidyl-prolyl cis-trans isomerase [Opitutaceae bacterium]|nr:FKBP-type peptidyl-prolyl cis-trans isomerase [Opitutaceae bacterium]
MILRLLLALCLLAGLTACSKSPSPAPAAAPAAPPAAGGVALESVEQRVSYGIGYNMGSGMARQGGFTPDQAALAAGIADGLAGAKIRIAEADLEAAFVALQQRMSAASTETAAKNLAAGGAFLEQNKARPGVVVTASGLQYEVLQRGAGPKALPANTVVVRYHGTLIDGTVFDSSVERGDTAEFPVTGVIPGWVEALQLMAAGDKFKLFIPAALAYGPRATGKIPPNSALIFEVELLQIK